MKTEKMKTKDIVTVVLLSLVNLVIFSIGSFLYATPVTILLMPVVYALLQGVVFFMLGVKVQKRGAMLLYCILQGVVAFNLPYLLMHLVAGVAAEAILKKTGYASCKGLTISYVVLQLLACVGSTVYPYALTLETTLSRITEQTELTANVRAAGQMIQSWGMAVLFLVVAVCALAGSALGWRVVRRHVLQTPEMEEEA